MENSRGKFIVFEGINGCGKTSQQMMLIERLKKEFPNKQTIPTFEASFDKPIGDIIRNCYILGHRWCDDIILLNLFALDRYDQFINPKDGIIKKINDGINIVQSRNYLSSLVLNCSDSSSINKVYNLNKISIDLLSPDIIIFLNRDINEILKFHENKNEIDINESKERLNKQVDGYKICIDWLRQHTNENIVEIKNNKSEEEVHEDVWNIVKDLF